MAEMRAKTKLDLDKIRATVGEASEEVLKQFAFRVIERAQANIRQNDQIDTGFMVNSLYAIWGDGSDYDAVKAAADPLKTGHKSGREVNEERMAQEASLKTGAQAAVVVGANYAIYQEARNEFLWPAAEATAGEFDGQAEKVYKKEVHD